MAATVLPGPARIATASTLPPTCSGDNIPCIAGMRQGILGKIRLKEGSLTLPYLARISLVPEDRRYGRMDIGKFDSNLGSIGPNKLRTGVRISEGAPSFLLLPVHRRIVQWTTTSAGECLTVDSQTVSSYPKLLQVMIKVLRLEPADLLPRHFSKHRIE